MKQVRIQYSNNTLLLIGLALLLIGLAGVGIVVALKLRTSMSPDDTALTEIEIAPENTTKSQGPGPSDESVSSSTDRQPEEAKQEEMDANKIAAIAAKHLNITGCDRKYEPMDSIQKQIMDEFHKRTLGKFNNRGKTKALQGVIFKYVTAEPGQTVSFHLKNPTKSYAARNELIKGKFKKKSGYYIYVDTDVYSLFDIDEQYHYLFDKGVCTKVSREKVKEIEDSFEKNKADALAKIIPDIESNFFPKAGYIQDEDAHWQTGKAYAEQLASKAERLRQALKQQ